MTCRFCHTPTGVRMVKVEGVDMMPLCPRCWGVYRETGERPPAFRLNRPARGPNTAGNVIDLGRLR